MKKSSKPAASPAPATSRATTPAPAPAAAPAPRKPAAAPAAASPAPAAVKKPVARANPPAAKVDPVTPPAKAATAPAGETVEVPNVTAITAKIDVGFGNALYIRGEGPGLSWNKGLPLKNTGADAWTISLPRSTRPIVFKFLLNDETWSAGADYTADPGASVTVSPSF